jgi:hypothetical protein
MSGLLHAGPMVATILVLRTVACVDALLFMTGRRLRWQTLCPDKNSILPRSLHLQLQKDASGSTHTC